MNYQAANRKDAGRRVDVMAIPPSSILAAEYLSAPHTKQTEGSRSRR